MRYNLKCVIMNIRWKVALLTLLGFSASACCGTKKAADIIINENEDPRIQLMYGVPFPDGSVVRPVDENGNVVPATPAAEGEGVRQPDGRIAVPLTDEEATKLVEQVKAEEAAKAE